MHVSADGASAPLTAYQLATPRQRPLPNRMNEGPKALLLDNLATPPTSKLNRSANTSANAAAIWRDEREAAGVNENEEEHSTSRLFPPRANVSISQLSIGEPTSRETPPQRLERFADFLPRLTPPSRRILDASLAAPLTTPLSTRNAAADGDKPDAVAPSPYIDRTASAILGSELRRKEIERMHRLITPQSVRVRQRRNTLSARKRPAMALFAAAATAAQEGDELDTTPPMHELQRPPTSILRIGTKRARIVDEGESCRRLAASESTIHNYRRPQDHVRPSKPRSRHSESRANTSRRRGGNFIHRICVARRHQYEQ